VDGPAVYDAHARVYRRRNLTHLHRDAPALASAARSFLERKSLIVVIATAVIVATTGIVATAVIATVVELAPYGPLGILPVGDVNVEPMRVLTERQA
jgi:hypothetical protein